jgi:hypothetical protein
MSAAAHFLIVDDAEGGFNVCDTRCGLSVAWRADVRDAASIAAHLNACYPVGLAAPSYDSLVHEVRMDRIGGEPVTPLDQLNRDDLARIVPTAVGGPLDLGLWRPRYGEEAV